MIVQKSSVNCRGVVDQTLGVATNTGPQWISHILSKGLCPVLNRIGQQMKREAVAGNCGDQANGHQEDEAPPGELGKSISGSIEGHI